MSSIGNSPSGSGANRPLSTARRTSIESITITSQSPGWDCSTIARPAPVPSYSLTLTVTSLASSNGPSSSGSAWSHQTSALSSAAPPAPGAMAAAIAARITTTSDSRPPNGRAFDPGHHFLSPCLSRNLVVPQYPRLSASRQHGLSDALEKSLADKGWSVVAGHPLRRRPELNERAREHPTEVRDGDGPADREAHRRTPPPIGLPTNLAQVFQEQVERMRLAPADGRLPIRRLAFLRLLDRAGGESPRRGRSAAETWADRLDAVRAGASRTSLVELDGMMAPATEAAPRIRRS